MIGKDTRLSGYMIETALVAGFTSVGMDVLLLGPMPTPAVAMLTRSMRADLGVMISASHNPFDDNGIKLFGPDGYKLSDEVEHKIETADRQRHDQAPGQRAANSAAPSGSTASTTATSNSPSARCRAISRSKACASSSIAPTAPAYRVAPDALWELGADVIPIGVEPDGFNINHECGSTAPDALCRKVREMRADIGIALDGDADRVVIADEQGHMVDGDQLLAVIAESWRDDGLLDQAGRRRHGDVESRRSSVTCNRCKLSLVRTPVGDRYVLEHMREHGYNVGGEPSGHIILSDYTTTGDGFVAALQILAVVKKQDKPVSQVCHRFAGVAAGAQERALSRRQAAGEFQGALGDRRCANSASTATAGW